MKYYIDKRYNSLYKSNGKDLYVWGYDWSGIDPDGYAVRDMARSWIKEKLHKSLKQLLRPIKEEDAFLIILENT